MVSVYCNYGLYDEDSCACLEEGDWVSEFSYIDDDLKITLLDVYILDIKKDAVILEVDDQYIAIDVDMIDSWK